VYVQSEKEVLSNFQIAVDYKFLKSNFNHELKDGARGLIERMWTIARKKTSFRFPEIILLL